MKKKMKKRLLPYKYLLIPAWLAISLTAYNQTYESSRSLREAFQAGPKTEVQVINKYGDIHLIPWEKDSVVFEIDLLVTSNKQTKVDKIFGYIDFDFKSTDYYVIAQTVFEGQSSFWSEIGDAASTIFSSGTNTRIDYTVYFPAASDVKIENKFGNIYTTDHTGKVDISLSNGDLKGHGFFGPSRFQIEFANVSINEIKDGTLLLGYTEMNLEKAGKLKFESRSSKLYLNNCEKIHLNSKRDRYYIKSVKELTGDAFFTYINVDKSGSLVNLKTNYGDFKLLGITKDFTNLDLNSEFTDITIYIKDENLYQFIITRDDRSQVLSSANVISKKEEPVDGLDKTFRAEVTAGATGKKKVFFIISIKSGKVYILGS